MFKITYQKVVEREQMGPSLAKIFNCQNLDQMTAYRALKIIRKMQHSAKEFGDKINLLNDKYATKDEAGKLIQKDDGKGNVGYEVKDEVASAYNDEVNALLSTEVEFHITKLQFQALAKANLSPKDYEVLEFMIEGHPEA